jgi:L-threonylcarbamoyladenylate synthase
MRRVTLQQATELLRNEKIVVFPTETVYGLGARADSARAVEAVYAAKGRPRDNPLICHFYSVDQIKMCGIAVSPIARMLFEFFSPGPISLLLPLTTPSVFTVATAGRPAILCRIPNHAVALELLQAVGVPLAAPSANTSGKMSGTELSMIEQDLGERVDGYLNGGPSVVGIESTIIDVQNPAMLKILRPGIIGVTELTTALTQAQKRGELDRIPEIIESTHDTATTPGSKYAHYAPKTLLTPFVWPAPLHDMPRVAAYIATEEWLSEQGIVSLFEPVMVKGIWYISLGSRRDLLGVARRLYYALYQLDQRHVSQACFVVEDWGQSSVASALRDRIGKILGTR